MRYCPVSSVTPVRTFVISAGLDASIVTPGSTAPDVSRTAPARLCALAKLGTAPTIAITARHRSRTRFMRGPPQPFGSRREPWALDDANGRTMDLSTIGCQGGRAGVSNVWTACRDVQYRGSLARAEKERIH